MTKNKQYNKPRMFRLSDDTYKKLLKIKKRGISWDKTFKKLLK